MPEAREHITIDTSVWVTYWKGPDSDEGPEKYAASAKVIESSEPYRIVVPTLVLAETAGAGAIRGTDLQIQDRRERMARVTEWLRSDFSRYMVVEWHERLAAEAADLALQHALKGGDAVILASAIATKSRALFSWDEDHLKLAEVEGVQMRSPAAFASWAQQLEL